MSDEELLAQSSGIPTFYLDGFGAYRKVNGVLRCIGFVLDTGAQINLIVSLAGADAANAETRRTLDGKPARCISIWHGEGLSH